MAFAAKLCFHRILVSKHPDFQFDPQQISAQFKTERSNLIHNQIFRFIGPVISSESGLVCAGAYQRDGRRTLLLNRDYSTAEFWYFQTTAIIIAVILRHGPAPHLPRPPHRPLNLCPCQSCVATAPMTNGKPTSWDQQQKKKKRQIHPSTLDSPVNFADIFAQI